MSTTNTNLKFRGSLLTVNGVPLQVGQKVPPFTLVGNDMKDITLDVFKGKVLIISVVPSLDTPVCSIQTKRLNQEASEFSSDVAILTVSEDLPFAQARWCGAEGVKNVITGSDYKYRTFGIPFGVFLEDMALLARSIFVVDKNGIIRHVEYVDELSSEPDYEAALKVVRELL